MFPYVFLKFEHSDLPKLAFKDPRVAALDKAGWTIRLELGEEDTSPDGHFDDPEAVAMVKKAIESGDEWAWFTAKVTVSSPSGVTGTDCLGACSCYTPDTWFAPDGYWPDMVLEAYRDAARQVKAAKKTKLPLPV